MEVDPTSQLRTSEELTKKRFEIKKWNAVALWGWDIDVDTCAICRNHTMELCIECQANQTSSTAQECVIAWGVCNELNKVRFLTAPFPNYKVCPLDNQEWEFQRYGR